VDIDALYVTLLSAGLNHYQLTVVIQSRSRYHQDESPFILSLIPGVLGLDDPMQCIVVVFHISGLSVPVIVNQLSGVS
jgi:hypothetical protein